MVSDNVYRFGVGVFVVCLVFLFVERVSASKQCGEASRYAMAGFTASGEVSDPSGLTAARRICPSGQG
jgi:rare lipoprotein A (peptidoglycan hydrolase)